MPSSSASDIHHTSSDKQHLLHNPLQSHELSQPSEWLLDSGATHHVTPDLHDLTLSSAYKGQEDKSDHTPGSSKSGTVQAAITHPS
ncbi:hypothetical protein MLD38_039308 [Melastoma candidum]|uniref:Uncharacterized protein n=1 Tax=Melastoma candidum TaxID=119954 RepID=A0ACB9L1P8_9MYRT|nr:hypothetical protein MLD38_039308 [Melastoma candidum]